MTTKPPSINPVAVCEEILRNEKAQNQAAGILRSEVAVVERMLKRTTDLTGAYAELHEKLHDHPRALHEFFDAVITTAAFWNPGAIEKARIDRDELERVNEQIAFMAAELADLLSKRSELHNTSGFSSNTYYSICDIIEAASQGNGLFASYVEDKFRALHHQFDLKYWPTLPDVLNELSRDAQAARPTPMDPLTAASTEASRGSLADFLKALFVAIDERRAHYYGPVPEDLRVSDKTIASLVNSVLDLDPVSLIDEGYVKRFRQRQRVAENTREPHGGRK